MKILSSHTKSYQFENFIFWSDSFTGEFVASFVPENRSDLDHNECDAKTHFAIQIVILVNRIHRFEDLWEYHNVQLIPDSINLSLVWRMHTRTLN